MLRAHPLLVNRWETKFGMKERDPDGNMRISVEQVEDIYRIYKVTPFGWKLHSKEN